MESEPEVTRAVTRAPDNESDLQPRPGPESETGGTGMSIEETSRPAPDPQPVYLIELGILDDGDVLPTVFLGLWQPPSVVSVGPTWDDDIADLVELLERMRVLCEEQYGRSVADSALFWKATPGEIDGWVEEGYRPEIELGGES